MTFIDFVVENNLGDISNDISFKEITTIGCGGHIDVVYTPNSIESLCKAYRFICQNNLKYLIVGNGSNILALDSFYSGIVIHVKKLPYFYNVVDKKLIVSAFYPTNKLAYNLAKEELGDLSFLGGIPGLLGGCVYNNGGAYNDNISNHVLSVKYINTAGNIVEITQSNCAFSYRKSIFHYIKGIIIEVSLEINKINTIDKLNDRKNKRLLTQPHEYKNMGSIFKNPQLIPAWKIIDALNMRGFKLGNAQVSEKHTNFIINLGNCNSQDILNIITIIQTRSKLEFGIELENEITIV